MSEVDKINQALCQGAAEWVIEGHMLKARDWPELGPDEDGARILDAVALALLLLHEEIMVANDGSLHVICSDTFAYACADAEPLVGPDAGDGEVFWSLYDLVREFPRWGSTIWVMRQRQCAPIGPIVSRMREAGAWADWMDDLLTHKES